MFGMKTKTGWVSSLWSCSQTMLRPTLTILMLLALSHVGITNAQNYKSDPRRQRPVEPDFLSHVTRAVRETLEDLIGEDNFLMLSKNLSFLVWTVSSGISAALFVVARIAGQFLTSFGIAGDEVTRFLKLSPDQVQILLLWGLVALVGYLVLSLLLSLVLAVLSRIMWGLKVVLFGACFMFIVSAVPDRSVQALLLLALLTFYALLGRLSGSHHSGARLEAKVRSLERQVEDLQRKQRRSAKLLDEE
ncbi:transmembrane protein 109 [Hemicordylus capensis]|uniref:transmembrane protein 109 n=1 Tax=Hemicordylus capensis TaxID=884348 RepID=UPI002304A1E3|nr:transmembrane protein 109 [Hemicordylus capensis]XP_053140747.1 transmembrane protein 109 [Hemicordylus capensis]XP_053140748.1 transmembrane protein 109 [Hemicordylus capensis]